MWSNKFLLLAMQESRFRIVFTMLSFWNTMFSMSYNIVYNISYSPSPAPGQALLGFHKNCSSSTARAECRSSSGAALSRRAAMSRIVRGGNSGNGGQTRADESLYVLPVRPGIAVHARHGVQLPCVQRARPCMQRARPGIQQGPSVSARGPGRLASTLPSSQRAAQRGGQASSARSLASWNSRGPAYSARGPSSSAPTCVWVRERVCVCY